MSVTIAKHGSCGGLRRKPYRCSLIGLENGLAGSLASALRAQGCRITSQAESSDIIFCGSQQAWIEAALEMSGGRPVIAVSRLPETSQWLDALEAGAADYCAAPFEAIHLRWLLDRHCRPPQAASAVA